MYDVKNDAREFVGDGRDEAVNKACQFFGVVDGTNRHTGVAHLAEDIWARIRVPPVERHTVESG